MRRLERPEHLLQQWKREKTNNSCSRGNHRDDYNIIWIALWLPWAFPASHAFSFICIHLASTPSRKKTLLCLLIISKPFLKRARKPTNCYCVCFLLSRKDKVTQCWLTEFSANGIPSISAVFSQPISSNSMTLLSSPQPVCPTSIRFASQHVCGRYS